MPPIITQDTLDRQLDFVLNHENNWRNTESIWNGLWVIIFTALLRETPSSQQPLTMGPEHPLVRWGVTRDEGILLQLDKRPYSNESTEKDPHLQRRPLDLANMEVPDTEYLPSDKGPTVANPRLMTTRSSTTAESTDPIIPSSSTDPAQTIELPPQNETRRARQGHDSSFKVDFMFYHIGDPVPDSKARKVFGHLTRVRITNYPFMLELKTTPSRSLFENTSDDLFYQSLSGQLLKAYNDIHLKAPVVFLSNPHQKSLIALAVSGYWWSFTLVRRDDSVVTWSKAYAIGQHQHDTLFRKLFAAAQNYPEDPARYENGWLSTFLSKHHRLDYNGKDCMAADSVSFTFE
ncbi:hypothetical protein RSAG8_07211, partial [Rhizoctonia solani AG-8 WAC10335]